MFYCKPWSSEMRNNIIVFDPSKHAEKCKSFKINNVIADLLQGTQRRSLSNGSRKRR